MREETLEILNELAEDDEPVSVTKSASNLRTGICLQNDGEDLKARSNYKNHMGYAERFEFEAKQQNY